MQVGELSKPDTTFMEAAQRAGVSLTAICVGEGSCGRCLVRFMDGVVSPPTGIEQAELGRDEAASGWRLACQTTVSDEVYIHVPSDSLVTAQRTQTEGQVIPAELHKFSMSN